MTAQVIPMEKPVRVCSFCRAPETQVKKLIGSGINSHCICDKCITKAKQRLEEAKTA
jgi:ATP-dependent protease Clp ATPase subunit